MSKKLTVCVTVLTMIMLMIEPQEMLADASRFDAINRVMHDLLGRLATDSLDRIAPAGRETR